MESLNLNTLASSLPTANLQNAEKDLMNNFKAAALSITTLYRSSRHTSKRAYNAGYAAACHELLMMIQQGVSVSGIGSASSSSHDPERGTMTIGKVMDWIEARLEAIKSREEEEDEDEEKEKERERKRTTAGLAKSDSEVVKPSMTTNAPATSVPRRKDQAISSLPTPNSPHSQPNAQGASQPSSPSPPPLTALRPIYPPNPPQRSKSRLSPTDPKHLPERPHSQPLPFAAVTTPILSSHHNGFTFTPDTIPLTPPPNLNTSNHPFPIADLAVGAKRRHAVMMMLDSTSPPMSIVGSSPGGTSRSHTPLPPVGNVSTTHTTAAGGSRRRTRSSRNLHQVQHHQNLSVNQSTEAMDVEDDGGGRERKRVTRR